MLFYLYIVQSKNLFLNQLLTIILSKKEKIEKYNNNRQAHFLERSFKLSKLVNSWLFYNSEFK